MHFHAFVSRCENWNWGTLSPWLLCGVGTRPPATENRLICTSLKPLYLFVLVNLFLLLGLGALFCEKLSTIANNLVNGAPKNVSTYMRSIRPGSLEHLSYKIRMKNQHQNLLVVIHAKIKRFLVPLSNSVIQRHLAKKASWACIYWEREKIERERLKDWKSRCNFWRSCRFLVVRLKRVSINLSIH